MNQELVTAVEVELRVRRLVEEAARTGSCYVDVTGVSRDPANRAMVTADGLHPSDEMYRLWAETALPQALAALRL